MKTKMEFLGLLFAIASIGSVHAADKPARWTTYAFERAMASDLEFWETRHDLTDAEKDAIAQESREVFDRVFAAEQRKFQEAQAAAAASQAAAAQAAGAGFDEEYPGAGAPANREYPCPDCSYVAQRVSVLNRHVVARHKPYSSYKFKCPKCEQRFYNSSRLEVHKGLKSDCSQFSIRCEQCGARFYSKTHLDRHIKENVDRH